MENDIFKNLLLDFKPIIIIYYPIEYYYENKLFRVDAIKNLLNESLKEKYILISIPHSDEDFKLDMLSVIKSKFINDSDLQKYIDAIQIGIKQNEQKLLDKSVRIKDYESVMDLIKTANKTNLF